MKYMGSKARIAKQIVPIIQKEIDDSGYDLYIEPFSGGMNVMDKVSAKHKIASDKDPYLIALWKHLIDGGELLPEVSRELYVSARDSWRNSDNKFPDWTLGNIGFLASFNGKGFVGGYAKSGWEKTKNGERFRDYYAESKRNILKQVENLKDVELICGDYKQFIDIKNAVIYCDPPYQHTTGYNSSKNFNHDEFWQFIRTISENNIVLVSEETAPEDFEVIWEKSVSRSLNASSKTKSVEKLFKLK